VNSSQAGYGMLYRYDDDFNFRLLASSGVSEEKLKKLKAVSQESCHHLTTLIKDRVRTSAFTDECDPGAFNLIDGLKWFIILPLTEYKELLGFLLLGFSKTKSLSNEELEFYDVFATHASTALIQAGIF
jgi:transcriptional regulator with GAF, ATPase, and Fis domain